MYVHCVLLPVFLTILPLWGVEVIEDIYIELGTIVVSAAAGGLAIWRGYKKHHQQLFIPLLFVSGLVLRIPANFIGTERSEMILKASGGLLVIIAHMLNWRTCRRCSVCENEMKSPVNSIKSCN